MPMICTSLNRLRFISPSPRWNGLDLKARTFAGNRSKEEAPGQRAGVDGISKAPVLDALFVLLADQIDRLLVKPPRPPQPA